MNKMEAPQLLTHLEQIDLTTKEGNWLLAAYSIIRHLMPDLKPHEVRALINEVLINEQKG